MAYATFNTVFHYSKKIANKRIQSLATKEYVNLRNEIVQLLNEKYEIWNAEFGNRDMSEYNSFIQEKQNDVIRQSGINEKSTFVTITSNDECDIIAVTKKSPLLQEGIKIYFTLQPIE